MKTVDKFRTASELFLRAFEERDDSNDWVICTDEKPKLKRDEFLEKLLLSTDCCSIFFDIADGSPCAYESAGCLLNYMSSHCELADRVLYKSELTPPYWCPHKEIKVLASAIKYKGARYKKAMKDFKHSYQSKVGQEIDDEGYPDALREFEESLEKIEDEIHHRYQVILGKLNA